jgi:hypothetical protein
MYVTQNHITRCKSGNILDVAESIVQSQINGSSIFIPHICNNQNIFIGGLSKNLNHRYPKIKANFEVAGKQPLGKTQFIKALDGFGDQNLYIVNMIAQNSTDTNKYRTLKYPALIQCMFSVKNYIDKLYQYAHPQSIQIHIAEFDFPCSKHEFKVITHIMEDIWTSIPIYIY